MTRTGPAGQSESASTPAADRGEPPLWPYLLPLAGFLALTALEGYLPRTTAGDPSPIWYPIGYTLKIVIVCGLVWASRQTLRDLAPRPSLGALVLAVGLGLLVAAAWVGLDGRYPALKFLGQRTAFDPAALARPARALVFLAVRMFGLVLVVPLIEELFYRSFLMRWIVDPDYTRVPIGGVTPLGLAVTTAVFGFSHPEWLPAVLTGLVWGGLLARTRSVSACVVSHAAANLALGVYVVVNGAWKYW